MATLKIPSERYKTIKYQDLLDKHEQKIKDARRKMEKFKDNPERCQKYQEQIDYSTKREEYYYWKMQDPISICEDFIISPTVNIEMVDFHFKQMFPSGKGYVSFMLGDGSGRINRRMMEVEKLNKKMPYLLSFDMNTYLSPANYAHRRTIKRDGEEVVLQGAHKNLIIESQAIIIDLDYRNTEFGVLLSEDFYELMLDDGAFDTLSEPSYCVISSEGRGMQLVYLLDEPYRTKFKPELMERYENTTRRMIEHFQKYGSDPACCDTGHLFRMPCSFNTKSGTYAYILNWEQLKDEDFEIIRYNFHDLEKHSLEALGMLPEPPKPEPIPVTPPTENAPVKPLKRPEPPTTTLAPEETSSLHRENRSNRLGKTARNRCNDLRKLIFIRNRNLIGFRNILLTIYASQYIILCKHREDAQDVLLEELSDVNKCFRSPLKEYEITNITKLHLKRRYSYTDQTICELLEITEPELQQLKHIGHPIDVEEYKAAWKRKRRRTPDGELKSIVKRRERNAQIVELRQQGWSLKEIAAELDISISTIKRVLKSST